MQIPSRFDFPDLVVHMCRQELVKRSVHYKMLLQELPHSLLLGHIPPALTMLLIPGCEGGSHPSPPNGEETGRAKLKSIPCIPNLLSRVTTINVIWREKTDILGDYSLKINHSLPFVIHSGLEATNE